MKRELDRLSCLPSELTEEILLHLSTRDAVRTSVLSSNWRYKWASLPCLRFDQQSISDTTTHFEIVNIVDHLLLLHIGPLHEVLLFHPNLFGTKDIDRWILHLSRNSIREFRFHFEMYGRNPYQLPSSLFSCRDMITLDLGYCLLKPPPSTFMGYQSLESLTLYDVMLSQDAIDRLIVSCPLLKLLELFACEGFTHLKVDAPKLETFFFNCHFENLCLEHTANLKVVSIALQTGRENRKASSSNLVKFFVQLPHIEKLKIHVYFLEYLAAGSSPPMLPQPCLYLHTLDLHIPFSYRSQIVTALCIMRNSPALTDLCISVDTDGHESPDYVPGGVHPWVPDEEIFSFSKLRRAKFKKISDIKVELDFIRLVLLSSPVLEKVAIMPLAVLNPTELQMKLIQFKRASEYAEMIFLKICCR